jgi:hypothetical protein
MRPRKPGDEADEEPRFRRSFDNGGVGLHAGQTNTPSRSLLFPAPPRLRVKPFPVN